MFVDLNLIVVWIFLFVPFVSLDKVDSYLESVDIELGLEIIVTGVVDTVDLDSESDNLELGLIVV